MIIDIIVGVVIVASALISFMRGFIREVLTIAGVIGGIVAAVFIGPVFAPTVREWFGAGEGEEKDPEKLFDIIPMEIVADATTYGTIFIAVVIVISVLSHFTAGAAKAIGLGPVDRTLGVIFGVVRALALLGLVYLPFHLLMDDDRKKEIFEGSNTHYIVEKIAAAMAEFLPESEEVEKEADDLIKKKLEDQNLLGNEKKPDDKNAAPDTSPAQSEKSGTGYENLQREKLEQLFNDPAVSE